MSWIPCADLHIIIDNATMTIVILLESARVYANVIFPPGGVSHSVPKTETKTTHLFT